MSWKKKSCFTVSAGGKELSVYFLFTTSFIQPLNVWKIWKCSTSVMSMLCLLVLMPLSQSYTFYSCVTTAWDFYHGKHEENWAACFQWFSVVVQNTLISPVLTNYFFFFLWIDLANMSVLKLCKHRALNFASYINLWC